MSNELIKVDQETFIHFILVLHLYGGIDLKISFLDFIPTQTMTTGSGVEYKTTFFANSTN